MLRQAKAYGTSPTQTIFVVLSPVFHGITSNEIKMKVKEHTGLSKVTLLVTQTERVHSPVWFSTGGGGQGTQQAWKHGMGLGLSLWWCGGTRSEPWSRRCRSWSQDWWASGQCSAQCCCVPETAGFSSQLCESPSSTGWWYARLAAARNPLCGWTRPVCDASDAHSAPHLWQQAEHVAEVISPQRPLTFSQIRANSPHLNWELATVRSAPFTSWSELIKISIMNSRYTVYHDVGGRVNRESLISDKGKHLFRVSNH